MAAPNLSEVAEGLHVGEHPLRAGALSEVLPELRRLGIGAIVTVCERPLDWATLRKHGVRGLHLDVVDCAAPDPDQLEEAVAFIRAARADGLQILVHCFAGIGRSATVACAYLIAEGLDPAEAIAQVRKRRSPFCVESAAQRDALLAWGRRFGFP